MLAHVSFVIQLVVQDVADHAQVERRIGARDHGDPLAGLAGGGGEMRVEHDDLAAGLLRIQERISLHHGAFQQVGAGDHERLGVHPVARLVRAAAEHVAADGRRGAVARAAVDAGFDAGGAAQKRRQEAEARLVGSGHVHGLLAVLVPGLPQLVAHRLDGLVPADHLERTLAACADAAHGRLQALIAVDVLDLGNALHAYVAIVRIDRVVGLDHGQAAVTHRAFERATPRAHELVQRVYGLLIGSLLRGGAQPGTATGHGTGGSQTRRARNADLEKIPTGQTAACALRSRHLSSSVISPKASTPRRAPPPVCNRAKETARDQAPPFVHTMDGQPLEPYITLMLN